jgi:hypothetical protein
MGRLNGITAQFVFIILAALLPSVAMAQEFQYKGSVVTENKYANAYLWITIYDIGKTKQHDYGCVDAGNSRTWQQDVYYWGHGAGKLGNLQVRGELMTQPGCKGMKLCDTTMETRPGRRLSFHRNKTDVNKCYWNIPEAGVQEGATYFIGGYTKSCTDIKLESDSTYTNLFLTARCRKANQQVVNSSLKMSGGTVCRGSVENQDGKLYCR